MKIIPKAYITNKKKADHVLNERDVLQLLSGKQGERENRPGDKFIMQLYSYFQCDDNVYLEVEYIRGCTLLS